MAAGLSDLIVENPEQPGSYVRPSLESRSLLDKGSEGRLSHFLSVFGVQACSPRRPEDLGQVGLRDGLKCLRVSFPYPCRQLWIVAVLSVIGVEIRVEELRRQIQSSGFGKTGSPTH